MSITVCKTSIIGPKISTGVHKIATSGCKMSTTSSKMSIMDPEVGTGVYKQQPVGTPTTSSKMSIMDPEMSSGVYKMSNNGSNVSTSEYGMTTGGYDVKIELQLSQGTN